MARLKEGSGKTSDFRVLKVALRIAKIFWLCPARQELSAKKKLPETPTWQKVMVDARLAILHVNGNAIQDSGFTGLRGASRAAMRTG